jgi:hypothetical protein
MIRLVEWVRKAGRWVWQMFAFRTSTAATPLTLLAPKTSAVRALPKD